MKLRLMIVVGTRPEAIKLAPVVLEARRRPAEFEVVLVRTSQHREMLDQTLRDFDLIADVDLDIMKPDQDLVHITTEGLRKLHEAIGVYRPDWVLVQGDTTTTFVGALAAFYQRVRVGHVEAGLRTGHKYTPFPEELNRCLATRLADLHFAPTSGARDNLLREAIDPSTVVVTGNTAIDALFCVLARHGGARAAATPRGTRRLLLTTHRRENHGAPMEQVCDAVRTLLDRYPNLHVRFPVHLSPRVRSIVWKRLHGHPRVMLGEPLDYGEFVQAMRDCDVILTDSGGVQEEAPSLGKPVLVLRETTERPEAVEAGAALLVGTDPQRIVQEVTRLFDDTEHYAAMSRAINPYGDGNAAKHVLDAISAAARA